MVARVVHFTGLTAIDRTLGFIFGLARGAFIVCLAYLLLDISLPQQNDRPSWIREAKSAPYLHQGAEVLRGFMPEAIKNKSADALDDAVKSFNPAAEAQKAMGAYLHPTPAPPPPIPPPSATAQKPDSAKAAAPLPAAQAPSYKPGDQKQLDRLIGTQR
jgi:membrane protein required for colicin V production